MDVQKYENSNRVENESTKRSSAVVLMVCVYIFLVIERPWESIRYLEGIKIEFSYALLLLLVVGLTGKLKIKGVKTDKWVFGLLLLHFFQAPFAYLPQEALNQGIEYGKMVVLYVLLVSVCEDEFDLKTVINAFVFSMMFYVLHSFWEYTNGRHVYRMEMARMIGVDYAYNDPNTFGASIVLSFPLTWELLKIETVRWKRIAYFGYFILGTICIVLTGSRSALVTFMCLLTISAFLKKKSNLVGALVCLLFFGSVLWGVMPEDKRVRMRTLWDEDAGPRNAHESAEGRVLGFKAGIQMLKNHPLTGVGTGRENFLRYRAENIDGLREQAHNLPGEVLGEMGLPGGILFLGLVVCIFSQFKGVLLKTSRGTFMHGLAGAGLITLLLLIIFGVGGHNFYRPMWLWLAAFSSISVIIVSTNIKSDSSTI